MRLTIPNYYPLPADVGPALDEVGWGKLRTQDADTHFSIPASKAAWIAKCKRNAEVQPRAQKIISLCRDEGVRTIVSHGVGGAWLEFHIKRLAPDIRLICCEYDHQALSRLEAAFTEADGFVRFDMAADDWFEPDALHLMHRVDPELSDRFWRTAFRRMATQGVRRVLFVASEVLTLRDLLDKANRYGRDFLRGRRNAHCGWLRTKASLRALWSGYYTDREVQIADLSGFWMSRR